MENSSKFQLQRTLSIQSCFQELNSIPASGGAEEPDLNNTGITSYPLVQVQPTYCSNGQIPNHTSMQSVPAGTQTHLISFSERVEGTYPARNLAMYVPLYHAALKGDWEKAKEFFYLHPQAITARITNRGESVLHIAAGAKQIIFVQELVKMMNSLDLALKNKYENTALCFAVASGITKIAELMVAKNSDLPMIRGINGVTALHIAALMGYRDMVWYIYSVTDNQFLSKEDYVGLLIATISSDLYDVALHILEHKPELAIEREPNGETALHVLARKTSAFSGKSKQDHCLIAKLLNKTGRTSNFRFLNHAMHLTGIQGVIEKMLMQSQALEFVKFLWKQVLFLLDDSEIERLFRSPSRPLFIAAEFGNFQFIRELILSYPDLIWKVDEQSRSIFHIAVIHRQEKIFKLLYDIGAHKDLITSSKNPNNCNILHLAANLAPSNRLKIVSGAALQMQRELLWFKEVEKNMQPLYKEMKDSEGRTPQMLFTQEHKGLVESGEKWMKDTASSCMLVATLITTVMFAAIFTVPGGNNNNTGTPMFLRDKSFIIFSISDALALFSSVTSILMFLSILTSRYAEEDFLESLPKRLIIGLTTLFFSIASMLLAFSASFFIVVGHQLAWVIIPIALTACVPVTLFAFLQFPLLADVMHSTYGSGIFSMERNERLY
ncbi:ankyrin repeat-containing protein ITN1-like isoform X2 [Olea europaea var. sylvestris]|uniref:Ankyrin repeat-containing ITN1-like isoform X1 n=1 Tax=Olea europaea subsp. europaea TaxID=158383 RepID=A0A8S0UFX3_OLEEU|nr:ankyrin repeat-containing protein ITN1-like isoform X2 [Olea europaea var. sylvestris]CAA3019051.1 ankyrin repeat-containing ITN1-like isoform X1 [Olea europaea subsp. europaea]